MSPKDGAEVAKSLGLRPEQSPLLQLDLAFDPFRAVYIYSYIYLHACMQEFNAEDYSII